LEYRLTNSRRAKITRLTADNPERIEQGDDQVPGGRSQPISFNTDIPKQPQIRLPESKLSLNKEAEDDEDNIRSMPRQERYASAAAKLTPKRCRELGCDEEFDRPYELTEHEKTHFPPWKCPVKSCKYHEYGWATEKELDRHRNDKHSATALSGIDSQESICSRITISKDLTSGDKARQAGLLAAFAKKRKSCFHQRNCTQKAGKPLFLKMQIPEGASPTPNLKFTAEDDQLLVDLKENRNLTWKRIAEFFPGRSSGTLQVRYLLWREESIESRTTA
jgi:hypothetical protein